ncbi:prepilin peptidase [Salisediminibacterium selenitireducens]|uniref:Peptidase A24A domain protein n=1 Tax=Bacillus selenitireducens (strain ATCC 700615 / DSM 15326 / MLS10) TaxID=439292 RepID=D6XT20_BACIE|nr:A24 family peptidase [Salisediminibacterium selenitireducens]ADH98956.1 peptidase A24A domain protein [[Bacillus] selenitireducens MLS10]
MDGLWFTYFVITGLVMGSFYNVVGLRVPAGESFTGKARSKCPSCGKTLGAPELIPVLSWFLLRGRCKGCGKRISPMYPLMELVTGVLFGLAFLHIGLSMELVVALLFLSMLVIITVSDLSTMLIPDKVLLFFGIPILLLRMSVAPLDPWWTAFAGAGLGFGILLLLAVASRGGMGGGDIKLYLVIGFVLGPIETVLSLFLAALVGLVYGLPRIVKRQTGRGNPIPFGPFIALGAVIAYFMGGAILDWYVGLLF